MVNRVTSVLLQLKINTENNLVLCSKRYPLCLILDLEEFCSKRCFGDLKSAVFPETEALGPRSEGP